MATVTRQESPGSLLYEGANDAFPVRAARGFRRLIRLLGFLLLVAGGLAILSHAARGAGPPRAWISLSVLGALVAFSSYLPRRAAVLALLLLFSVSTVAPLFWMLSTSLKQPSVPYTNFWPGIPTLANYTKVFEVIPFGRFYINSVLVAVIVTFGQVFTSALAGYAFARLEFPGRNKIFLAYLATMMIPQAVTMVPQFMLLTQLPEWLNHTFRTTYFSDEQYFLGKWFAGAAIGVDSYFVLIVPMLFSPYGTFLLRQFFLGIPKELDEAAMIDGCGRFQIFRLIILPLSKPALATLATFTFMGAWRNFLWPLIMTNSMEMKTLPVGLAAFMGTYNADWRVMMAGAMMMIIPMIFVFLLCQKWFVEGIQIGAVKG
jgi:multiple sugar transport system permease protein